MKKLTILVLIAIMSLILLSGCSDCKKVADEAIDKYKKDVLPGVISNAVASAKADWEKTEKAPLLAQIEKLSYKPTKEQVLKAVQTWKDTNPKSLDPMDLLNFTKGLGINGDLVVVFCEGQNVGWSFAGYELADKTRLDIWALEQKSYTIKLNEPIVGFPKTSARVIRILTT